MRHFKLVAWLARSQAMPAGKWISVFVLSAILILTLAVASLHAAAMIFNGYCDHVESLILRAVPHLSIVKYEAGERIGARPFAQAESSWLLERLRSMPEAGGALPVMHENATVEISAGSVRVRRRLKVMGLGAGFGNCPLPLLEPYAGLLADGNQHPVVISSDVAQGLQVGSTVKIETRVGSITATIIGIPDSGVMPLSMIALPMTATAELLDFDEPNAIFVKLRPGLDTRGTVERMRESLKANAPAKFLFSFWQETVEEIFGVLAAFKALLFGMFSALLIMAAIFCYAAFEVAVVRRRKHMATLVALGLPPSATRRVFHVLGLTMGIVSSVLGVALSFLVVKSTGLLPLTTILSASGLTQIPQDVRGFDLIALMLMTSAFAWIAARLASRPLLRLDPAEEMRQ